MGYQPSEERDASPWVIENLKPIQIANVDLDEYKELRKNFNKDEWIDLLMQSHRIESRRIHLPFKTYSVGSFDTFL